PISRDGYDFVIGERDLSNYPIIKKLGNFGLTTIAKILTPTGINDPESGFRVISSDAAKRIHLRALKYDICMDFVYNVWKHKLKTKTIRITVPMYHPNKGTKITTGFRNMTFLIKRRLFG
ncbi:MAG: hypothetical protein ABIA21_00215, partial [Candidatus Aenigmatarchaeota archaeon]